MLKPVFSAVPCAEYMYIHAESKIFPNLTGNNSGLLVIFITYPRKSSAFRLCLRTGIPVNRSDNTGIVYKKSRYTLVIIGNTYWGSVLFGGAFRAETGVTHYIIIDKSAVFVKRNGNQNDTKL